MNRDTQLIKIVVVLLALLAALHLRLSAQSLNITGEVIDLADGSPIVGASVSVEGTQAAVRTDARGRFSIRTGRGVTLVFRSLGYVQQSATVIDSEKPLVIRLKRANIVMDEVAVDATKRTNTEIALLDERKRAGIVQDGISAELIERTGSLTTTQAIQRVVGVTVTDEKYVAVRGMGDRSVIGQLNGARLASSNPDRSAIPLDLIPAALLDNLTVYKTFTPDKPADAAAGIVELKTKSIPDTLLFEVAVNAGFNSGIGIGGQYNSFDNADMGLLGNRINDKNLSADFLGLSAKYPNGLGSIQRLIANTNFSPDTRAEVSRINSLMQGFDQTMTTRYATAPVNQSYSVTFGNRYKMFGNHRLGVVIGGNYYRRYNDVYEGDVTQYSVYQGVVTGNDQLYSPRYIPNYITPNNLYMGRYQTYKENTGTETLNYGVLAGLAYRFSPRHQVSGQFLGSWGGETGATNMHGAYQYAGMAGDVQSVINSLKQTYRTLYAYNLQGEHKFLPGEYSPVLGYGASTSSSSHNDPDYRFTSLAIYTPTDEPDVHQYALTSGYVNGYGPYGVIQAEPNGRRWRYLDETNYNYKADLELPFRWLDQKQLLKVGVNYLFREREFTENHLFLPGSNFTDYGSQPLYEVYGDLDRLVSNEVVGIKYDGLTSGEGGMPVSGFLYNSQKSPNNYTGYYKTNALYAMVDLKPVESWRITGGVRFESTDIASRVDTSDVFLDPSLTTVTEDGQRLPMVLIEPNSRYETGYKPFYSVNVTYTFRDDMNFRAGYNTTLARPELREITNVFEYDPFQLGLVVGNPDLVNQTTHNFDFRWEWFSEPGEVLAVSAFGKRIHNQLVKVFSLRTEGLAATYPEFPAIRFENEQNVGKVWGMEFEAVKSLAAVWDPLRNLFIGANLMLAQSDIRKSDLRYRANMSLDHHSPRNSPLFEQPPYAINAWLNYDNKRWGIDLTATFNMVGERLVQINLLGEPDLYSQPVPMLDFVFSQRIHRRLTLKGFAKNVLDAAYETVYANPGTGGTWYGNEYVQRSYKRGVEFMLGLTYNVF